MNKKMYLTKDGLEELKKEHEQLIKTRRPEVVRRVSEARNMGDLSENAEYTAAREELAFIDGRVEELEEFLKSVVLIDDTNTTGSKGKMIQLGSKVTVKVNGKEEVYMVVGEWEADPTEKKISNESPLGKSLLGKSIGDEVEVSAPVGKIHYKIASIN